MDCREWEGKDLSEGYKKFVDMLGQVNAQLDDYIMTSMLTICASLF